jgi:uncharacterized membrane protein YecN with MAPEG domain
MRESILRVFEYLVIILVLVLFVIPQLMEFESLIVRFCGLILLVPVFLFVVATMKELKGILTKK